MDLHAEQTAALTAAAAAVSAGKFSLRKACVRFGVQFSKLFRVLHGIQSADAKRGAPTAVPRVVEDKLAEKLLLLVKNHMYLSMKNLPILAREICASLGIKRTKWVAGKKWVKNFFKRHPELSPRKTGKISRARSLNFNECTHAEWYAAIKELVGFYLPKEIFNTDDTGCVSNFPSWAHSYALSLFSRPFSRFPQPSR